MALHQVLQTVWRQAGQTILWWSALAVFVSGVIAVAGWRRLRSLERQGPSRLPDQFPAEQVAFESGILDVAAEAAAVLRQFQDLAAQQLARLEMASSRVSRSGPINAPSGQSWETPCAMLSSNRHADVSC